MKNILVPTDFSDTARVAEQTGIELAKKAGADIHFQHIVQTPTDWVDISLEEEEQYPETKAEIGHAKHELDKLKDRATKEGVQARVFLAFDQSKKGISQHVREHDHDFVVMGSYGKKGIKKVIGTNTQELIRHANAPVLVIKSGSKEIAFKNIVFPSDFEEEVLRPFKTVLNFAEVTGAKTHLLNVNLPFHFKETDQSMEAMRNFLEKCPKGDCSINIFNALNEERGIQKFAKENDMDLIAMTTHGRTGFMNMISPSITESVVNNSDLPVLSVNIHNEEKGGE